MSKAFRQVPRHSVSVETWVSTANSADVSSLTQPYPANVRHHVKVHWTAGYTTDFEVDGLMAQGHPQLRYDLTGEPANWTKPLNNVVASGEETCGVKVDTGTVIARVQCPQVRFKSVWSGWVSVLSTALEVRISVS